MTVLITKAKCKVLGIWNMGLARELHKAGVGLDCYVEFGFFESKNTRRPLHQTAAVYGDMKYGGTPEYFFLWASHATLSLVPVRHLICPCLAVTVKT